MSYLILVRHGLTEWSVQDRRLGSSDIPLNETGRRQARWLAETLATVPITRIISSDLGRALSTASAIAERHGLQVAVDARIRERDHGVFEGSPRQVENGVDVTSQLDPAEAAASGVESIDAVWKRVLAAYTEMRAAASGVTVVVSHYGPLRLMLAASLGLGADGRRLLEMECGAFSVVKVGPKGDQLVSLNVGGNFLRTIGVAAPTLEAAPAPS